MTTLAKSAKNTLVSLNRYGIADAARIRATRQILRGAVVINPKKPPIASPAKGSGTKKIG
jgi:hypothetical protein